MIPLKLEASLFRQTTNKNHSRKFRTQRISHKIGLAWLCGKSSIGGTQIVKLCKSHKIERQIDNHGSKSYLGLTKQINKVKFHFTLVNQTQDLIINPWFITGFSYGESCFTIKISPLPPPWHPPLTYLFPFPNTSFPLSSVEERGKDRQRKGEKRYPGMGGGPAVPGPPAGKNQKFSTEEMNLF